MQCLPKNNLNYIQALEKAVKEKYGDLATYNPKYFWNDIKEKEYIEDIKIFSEIQNKNLDSREKIEIDGMYISKNVLDQKQNRVCSECKKYSFNQRDDLYLNKFNSCYKCYLCKEG